MRPAITRRASGGQRGSRTISSSTFLRRTRRGCASCSTARRSTALLRRLLELRGETGYRVPLLLKIAPDLTPEERKDIAQVALETGIDGLIVSNTTVDRPPGLVSRYAGEAGGLSGRPLFAPSTALLADMYRLTRGRLPLIGVGGIASAEDAYAKIRAGASLVQLYTALVFAGPDLVTRIKSGLASLLRRDGFASVTGAIGTDAGMPLLTPLDLKARRAARDRDGTGARHLDEPERLHQRDEGVEFLARSGHLEDKALGRRIDDAGAEDVGETQRLRSAPRLCP